MYRALLLSHNYHLSLPKNTPPCVDGRLSGYVNTINMWTGSEVFIFLGYGPASLYDSCPTFQNSVVISSSRVQYPMNNAGTGGYRNINVSVNGVWLAGKLSWPILNRSWQPTADRMFQNKFATLQGNFP